YPPADYKRVWNSLFKMWELFEETAAAVAEHLNEQYLFAEAEKVRQYLRRVQQLKPDAKEID
ncbi:aminoglycoside 6-adenylyltransferase, partial [Enterococcus faecalis]